MKLGSLFDGSGGFPLAGSLCGIAPVWASEVEPYPIAVTRSRFPNMKHLGDINKVNGAEIEPVDVITFGSPCQDLSVAGKRAGLKHEDNGDDETTRSGLFMEAVRIIKEMRKATNGLYPRFAVWENVPGAFSSNGGEDFRTVLEELIKIVEPSAVMPPVPKNGWPYADHYCGDGWSLAYRVFDTQYWGVPQRRRRIYLVADFRDECARKVLFERKGLRGYFATGGTPWQRTSVASEDCTGAADSAAECVTLEPGIAAREGGHIYKGVSGTLRANAGDNQMAVAYRSAGFKAGNGAKAAGIGYHEEIATTLAATPSGTNQVPAIVQPVPSILLDDQGGSQMSVRTDGKSPTLRAETHGNVPCVLEQHLPHPVSIENHPSDSRVTINESGKVQTLESRMGTGGGNVPMVMEPKNVYCLQGNGIDRADTAGCNGKGWKEDVCYTLNTIDRPAVAYGIGNGQTNQAVMKERCGTLNCMHDQQAIVHGMDCRNGRLNGDLSGTMQAKPNGGFSYNCIHPGIVKTPIRYIVRRLTPTECARLQGFPDCWGHLKQKNELTDAELRFWTDVRNTHASINGKAVKEYMAAQMLTWYNKLHTDSAEYKMWGNGIALPTALYVIQGIEKTIKEENHG